MSKIFRKITSSVMPQNPLLVSIQVYSTIPGVVYVIYSNKKAGKFISATTSEFKTKNIVHLARLRAITTYKYNVILVTSCGQTYISEDKFFKTNPLPEKIIQSLNFSLSGHFSKDYLIVLCVNGIESPPNFFQGYIAVDFDGQIVWYYQSLEGETPVSGDFFQLDSGNFLITYGHTLGTPDLLAGIGQAAQMQIINGLGKLLYRQPLVCVNNPANIGVKFSTIAEFGWTHASWEDPERKNVIMNLGLQLRDPFYDAGLDPPGTRMQLGATIREWIPSTGEQKIITSDFNLLNPLTYRGTLSNDDYGVPVNCSGIPPGFENQDWTHGNAISRLNSKTNWIISQRNTSSVLILEPNTFQLLLKFGVTQPSDLSFINTNDQFYNQHDAHELCNGNILMFDDGTTRPESEGGEYARAIEFSLDLKNKKLIKVWEFRPPKDIQCNNNGSARRLNNGHTIVDFGASNLDVKHIFEACRKSNKVVCDLSISSSLKGNQFTIFRAVPIKSILGEILFKKSKN